MTDRSTFVQNAAALHRKDVQNTVEIGSAERFYRGDGNLCQMVIMATQSVIDYGDREGRVEFYRWLFNRPTIGSTKDLTLGEGKTILAFKEQLKELYEQFHRVHQ